MPLIRARLAAAVAVALIVFTPNGGTAPHGFAALSEFDTNADGVVDRHDAGWSRLLLWIDEDHNGISTPAEMDPIRDGPVTALEYRVAVVGRTDRWGNRFRYMSHFTMRAEDGSEERHACYDVFFAELPRDD